MNMGRTRIAAAFWGREGWWLFFKKTQKSGACQEKKMSNIFSIVSWLRKWGCDSHGKWEGLGNTPGCK